MRSRGPRHLLLIALNGVVAGVGAYLVLGLVFLLAVTVTRSGAAPIPDVAYQAGLLGCAGVSTASLFALDRAVGPPGVVLWVGPPGSAGATFAGVLGIVTLSTFGLGPAAWITGPLCVWLLISGALPGV